MNAADIATMADTVLVDRRVQLTDEQVRELAAEYLQTLDDLAAARSAREQKHAEIGRLTAELNQAKLDAAFRRVTASDGAIAKLERDLGHDDEQTVDVAGAPVPQWLQTLRTAGAL